MLLLLLMPLMIVQCFMLEMLELLEMDGRVFLLLLALGFYCLYLVVTLREPIPQ